MFFSVPASAQYKIANNLLSYKGYNNIQSAGTNDSIRITAADLKVFLNGSYNASLTQNALQIKWCIEDCDGKEYPITAFFSTVYYNTTSNEWIFYKANTPETAFSASIKLKRRATLVVGNKEVDASASNTVNLYFLAMENSSLVAVNSCNTLYLKEGPVLQFKTATASTQNNFNKCFNLTFSVGFQYSNDSVNWVDKPGPSPYRASDNKPLGYTPLQFIGQSNDPFKNQTVYTRMYLQPNGLNGFKSIVNADKTTSVLKQNFIPRVIIVDEVNTFLKDVLQNGCEGDIIEFSTALNGQTIVLPATPVSDITRSIFIRGFSGTAPIRINIQRAGGGSVFKLTDNNKTLQLENLTISNSGSNAVNGGAIFCNGNLKITGCTFNNNEGNLGGAIYCTGKLNLQNSTISGNRATKGGALFLNTATSIITNSTIAFNKASIKLGGVYLVNLAGTTVSSCIFAKNTEGLTASGSDFGAEFIPKYNTDNYTSISSGYNFFGSKPKNCNTNSLDIVSTPANPMDPVLLPLAANGVLNRPFTHAISICGSPFINTGNDNGISQDQRGLPINGTRDIGAYEYQNTDTLFPGVLYVTNNQPNGPGSLKFIAENQVCANDTIRFSPSLDGALIEPDTTIFPNRDVVIDAQNLHITISGKNKNRIFDIDNKIVFLNNLTLTNGYANGSGGIFEIGFGGKLKLQGCLLRNSKATIKGGVINLNPGSFVEIANSTFSGNAAGELGGAICINGGVFYCNSATVAFNRVLSTNVQHGGGGVAVTGPYTGGFHNSIISNNSSGASGQDIRQTNAANYINNSYGDYNLFGIVEPASGAINFNVNDVYGTISNPKDPGLSILSDNGGPTKTHALACSGLAKNTGFHLSASVSLSGLSNIDQRGVIRSSPYDRGAYQDKYAFVKFDNFILSDSSNNAIPSNFFSKQYGSLQEAINKVCDGGIIMANDTTYLYYANHKDSFVTYYKKFGFEVTDDIKISKNITIDFNQSTITFLSADGNKGMFRISGNNTVTIKNAIIEGRSDKISQRGQVALLTGNSKIIFENCIFRNLRAKEGAVAYGGKITAINCQFNSDSAGTGILYSRDSIKLLGCTFTKNTVNDAVVMISGPNGILELGLNVIGDNSFIDTVNGSDVFVDQNAVVKSLGYNLVSYSNTSWGIGSDFDGKWVHNAVNLEPRNIPNIGTVYYPACYSLAYANGQPGIAAINLKKDLLGFTRVNDRGAVQRNTSKLVTNTDTTEDVPGSFLYVLKNTCDSVIIDSSLSYQELPLAGMFIRKNVVIHSLAKDFRFVGKGSNYPVSVFIVDSNRTVIFNFLTFKGSSAAPGFAIYSRDKAITRINQCTFDSCGSTDSFAQAVSGYGLQITRSTFGNNFGPGAPVYSKGNLSMSYCTIAYNQSSGIAGGLRTDNSTNTIANSIIAQNQFSTGGGDIYNQNNLTSLGYNFIGVIPSTNGFTIFGNRDTVGVESAPIMPYLDSVLSFNNGITKTFALKNTSYCIDNGNPFLFGKDQREYAVINKSDIGSFEFAAPCSQTINTFTSKIGNSSATINFTGVSSAGSFNYRYKEISAPVWNLGTINNPATRSVLLSGLKSNTTYVWQVQSLCYNGLESTAYGKENYFTTGCLLPDSIWISKADTNAITFNWTAVPDNIGFILSLYHVTDTNVLPQTVSLTGGVYSHRFMGLTSNTLYELRFNTLCNADSGMTKKLLAKTSVTELPYIRLVFPNNPAYFHDCAQHTLYWTNSGLSNRYRIEISYNNGKTYSVIDSNYYTLKNEFLWSVPAGKMDSCRIKISDAVNNSACDTTDNFFGINNVPEKPKLISDGSYLCFGQSEVISVKLDSVLFKPNSYLWSLPAGYFGFSDTSFIRVKAPAFPTVGNIYVLAINTCGNSLPVGIQAITGVVKKNWNKTICAGESVTFNQQWINKPGIYYDTLTTSQGCDSLVTLNLQVNSIEKPVITSNGNKLSTGAFAGYQWLNCERNELIAGETNAVFNASASGSYAVIVNNGSCSDTSDCYKIQVTDINALEDLLNKIEVYPVPSSGPVYIKTNGFNHKIQEVTVLNLMGETISEYRALLSNSKSISILQRGIYILQIRTNIGVVRRRVIVE